MSDIPKGWVTATIPDLIGIEGVFVDGDWVESKDQDQNGDVRLIQLADIGDGRYVDKSNRFLTHTKAMELGCTFLRHGDVLIARMPDPLGRACIFPGDKRRAVTVVDVCIVRGCPEHFDHSWLMYFINSSAFRADIHSLQSGSTRKRISRGNLSTLKLPVPPRAEQTRIVAKLEELLSDLDAGVAELKAAQKKLGQYRQSLLKAAVEGALTAEWRARQSPSPQPLSRQGRGALLAPVSTCGAPLPTCGGGAGGEGVHIDSSPKAHQQTSPIQQQRARELRRNQTPHEQALWHQLRAKRFDGCKFRRQQSLGPYIVDFVCFDKRLIIELDGSQHADQHDYDAERDAWLTQQGFRVLRFWNNQWTAQPESVLEAIWLALRQEPPLPNPSPTRGEGPEYRTDVARASIPPCMGDDGGAAFAPLSLNGRWAGAEAFAPLSLNGRWAGVEAFAPLSLNGRGAGGEGETGAQLLQRILSERRARWEAKQLAKFAEQGKAPPKDWQKKYPEPVQPDTTDLPTLPEGWVWASVDQLSESVRNGLSKTPNTELRGFPIFKINAVRPMSVNFDAIKHIEIDESEASDYWVEVGDVLATRYNGSVDLLGVFGMVKNVSERTLHPDKLIRMKPVTGAELGAWMEVCGNVGLSRKHLVVRVKTTAGQTGISGEDLKKTPIPLPPEMEQKVALSVLEERLQAVKELELPIEHGLKQSTAQRQNILHAAFAGQLVPQDLNDEPASVLLERIRAERAAQASVKKPRGRQTPIQE
ncbi:MAG: DUF559 domain-containing protein [Gammaproteobacteria bacterium]|nr:DUF559 domain-containing protein [Gammaproteobacteria bacterium]